MSHYQYPHQPYPPYPPQQPQPRKGLPACAWVLIVLGVLAVLLLATCFGSLPYIGTVGPETHVYTGREMPQRFVDTLRELEMLEDDEQILYFYSDALLDIRNGLYFVTDCKVGVYVKEWAVPRNIMPFSEIAEADLERDTSFFTDSLITLELTNSEWISFPVSSEKDRDQQFFQAITQRLAPPAAHQP